MRLPRRAVAATAACTLAGTLLAATTATAARTPVWASTATKPVLLSGGESLGLIPAGTSLRIALALTPRDPAGATALLRSVSAPGSADYHRFLTPAQYTARFAPAATTSAAVVHYLRAQGFTDVTVLPTRLLVTASGSAATAERAFHTTLSRFRVGPRTVYGNTSPAMVPTALAGAVTAVLGLNDLPLPTPHPVRSTHRAAAGSPDPFVELPPKYFQNTYDATRTPTGSKTTIALLTVGDLRQVYRDLRLAERVNHLPQVPVSQVDVGPQSNDTSGLDEWDMDTQVSTAMATTVKRLYLYNIASLVDSDVVADFATFAAQRRATAMSASIGGCDLNAYLDGSMVATDVVLQEAALQGQTLFASSGDNGEGCAYVAATGVPSGFPGTNWPASGEYTTAVGGTSLLTDARGNRVQELAWAGSGGGISEVENPGFWQQASNIGYDAQFATGGRAVPDVALDADPNTFTAAQVYVNGAPTGVGGTSLSSPLMLGAWARLESAHHNALGLASIAFYRLYDQANPGTNVPGAPVPATVPTIGATAVKGFTDVVAGTNGLWVAAPGYDEVTGIGTPDLQALNPRLR